MAPVRPTPAVAPRGGRPAATLRLGLPASRRRALRPPRFAAARPAARGRAPNAPAPQPGPGRRHALPSAARGPAHGARGRSPAGGRRLLAEARRAPTGERGKGGAKGGAGGGRRALALRPLRPDGARSPNAPPEPRPNRGPWGARRPWPCTSPPAGRVPGAAPPPHPGPPGRLSGLVDLPLAPVRLWQWSTRPEPRAESQVTPLMASSRTPKTELRPSWRSPPGLHPSGRLLNSP